MDGQTDMNVAIVIWSLGPEIQIPRDFTASSALVLSCRAECKSVRVTITGYSWSREQTLLKTTIVVNRIMNYGATGMY